MLSVLLIDDDEFEDAVVRKVLSLELKDDFELVYVQKCSQAMACLNERAFDLILLDNRLTRSIDAQMTVPMIRSTAHQAPIAIISNSLAPDYLSGPEVLDVDYVVDKRDLVPFLNGVCQAYRDEATRKVQRPA